MAGFRLKAIVAAEESGLFLDGLDGFPSTHTARWSPGDDHDRALLLLVRMRDVQNRAARFVSAVCLLYPDGQKTLCEGVLCGRVALMYRGVPEDGYDWMTAEPSPKPARKRSALLTIETEL